MPRLTGAWRWALFVLVIAALATHIGLNRSRYPPIEEIPWQVVFILFGMESVFLVSNAAILRLLAGAYGVALAKGDALALTTLSGVANYVAPFQAGTAFRAVYLRQTHGLRLSSYVALSAVTTLLNLVLLSLGGGVCLLVVGSAVSPFFPILIGGVAFVAMGLLAWATVSARGSSADEPATASDSRVVAVLYRIAYGVRLLFRSPRTLVLLALLLFINSLILTSELFITLHFLGKGIPFVSTYLANSMRVVTILVSLTPGNLGVVESALAVGGAGVGGEFESSLLAAGLMRLSNLLTLSVWGTVAFFLWVRPRRR